MNIKDLCNGWLDWILPCYCCGCNNQVVTPNKPLCYQCLAELRAIKYDEPHSTKLENNFWGRLPLRSALAIYPLKSESVLHRSLHQLKYHHRPGIGYYLGKIAGDTLIKQNALADIDALIPLPLHPNKKRKRGYNQAERICRGLSAITQIPVWEDVVKRDRSTESQTRKDREERWENMSGKFSLKNKLNAAGKHLLLVDDVITTGATLEACGQALLQIPGIQLSLFSLAYTENG